MKALVLEIRDGYAAVLREDGVVAQVRQDNCQVGENIEWTESAAEKIVIPPKAEKKPKGEPVGEKLKAVFQKIRPSTPIARKRWIQSAIAAMLALVILGSSYTYTSALAASYVSLDVDESSSVEFSINRRGRVIAVTPINAGAQDLAASIRDDVRNMKVDDALSTAVAYLTSEGYLNGEDSSIIASVTTGSEKSDAELSQTVARSVEESKNGDVRLYMLSASQTDRTQALAQELSPGRYLIRQSGMEPEARSDDATDVLLSRPGDGQARVTQENDPAANPPERAEESVPADAQEEESVFLMAANTPTPAPTSAPTPTPNRSTSSSSSTSGQNASSNTSSRNNSTNSTSNTSTRSSSRATATPTPSPARPTATPIPAQPTQAPSRSTGTSGEDSGEFEPELPRSEQPTQAPSSDLSEYGEEELPRRGERPVTTDGGVSGGTERETPAEQPETPPARSETSSNPDSGLDYVPGQSENTPPASSNTETPPARSETSSNPDSGLDYVPGQSENTPPASSNTETPPARSETSSNPDSGLDYVPSQSSESTSSAPRNTETPSARSETSNPDSGLDYVPNQSSEATAPPRQETSNSGSSRNPDSGLDYVPGQSSESTSTPRQEESRPEPPPASSSSSNSGSSDSGSSSSNGGGSSSESAPPPPSDNGGSSGGGSDAPSGGDSGSGEEDVAF